MLATVVEEVAKETPFLWYAIGFGGQAVFGSRFLVQWIASERAGRSVVPQVFWYMSILGGLLLLSYALFWLGDPVFTLGQACGTFVYVRNLQLLSREKQRIAAEGARE